MAIPFAMPDDDDTEVSIDLLFAQLYDLLRLLQIQMRRRSRQLNPQRVRNPVTSNRRNTTTATQNVPTETYPTDRLPDLVNNLALLTATSTTAPHTGNTDTDIPVQNLPTRNNRRRRRRRLTSDSSCCEETKATVSSQEVDVTNQDWTQVGDILRKIAIDYEPAANKEENSSAQAQRQSKSSCTSESIFSKLVPVAPFSGSICTAVICMVGWHFLWAR